MERCVAAVRACAMTCRPARADDCKGGLHHATIAGRMDEAGCFQNERRMTIMSFVVRPEVLNDILGRVARGPSARRKAGRKEITRGGLTSRYEPLKYPQLGLC